ncbi:response regulator aspartate phosphatase [Alkalicoccobacillus murimartini]|uniref:Response regulator aspartate phosphatase B n=1 Tax=Alkalicoccobacillus murimartini TaxID=171685 RepID=A0ABT9YI29_9BACI|nr:hypothetical protein [Alkalicoccobacillus murimartini]MDQ0207518.1 response regulator aspartate phosphatase B [Alkalicoccobacillus murimartini]
MKALIPAEEVGVICVKWYSCIVAQDYDEADALRLEATESIQNMFPDDKVIAYYSLIEYRHKLMKEGATSQLDESKLKNIKNLDPILTFYYYFMSGLGGFYKAHYKDAIRLYNKAESLLEHVADPFEQAEFYQRIGEGYYRIYQYTFAVSYIERALDIFKQDAIYIEKELDNRHLLAAITSERNQEREAEDQYLELIGVAKDYSSPLSLIYQSFAFHYLRKNDQNQAKKYIIKALESIEHSSTINGMKSKGELAFIHLRMGEIDQGLPLLEEVEAKADKVEDIEYQLRCLINRHLYIDFDKSRVDEGIRQLEEAELYFDAIEVCQDVSRFFEERDHHIEALHYLKHALYLKGFQFTIGGEGTE